MTVLEQLKLENPNLALLPDDELIERLLLEYQGDLDPETFRQSLLAEQPVVSPVTSPVAGGKRAFTPTQTPSDIGFTQSFVGPTKSSWQRSWGPAITRLRGGIAGLMGNDERAQELYNQAAEQDRNILNQEGYVSFQQATEGPDAGVDTFVKAGLSAIGQSSPFLVEGVAGAVAGAKIGRFAGPIGALVGAGVGAAAASFPRLFEFNISRQQEQVNLGNLDSINEARAATLALPAAVAEAALYPVLGKLFGPLNRTQFASVLNRATTGRVAKGTATGVAAEAATEVGQQALERYQAGLPLDTPEAIAEFKEAAMAGGFVGGAFGGAATLAGEVTRTPQTAPVETPAETPVAKPVEAPKVEAGIIQPQQQKERAKEEAVQEQAKPANFAVQQEGDKFVVKNQELDANNNVIKTDNQGVFNTQAEATAKQQELQDQKNKISEQTFFTADEIKQQDPTLGNIIDEVESQGAKISPGTKQVYYRKDLALPEGDLTNVMNSGGTAGSVADGWYDRTSDLVYVSLADLGKVKETVAHENFHALQRVTDRVSPNLFTEQEQTALDTFLPGGTIDSITPNVQRALGNDVMNTLRERHADRSISNREMQAYAFGAYATLRNNNRLLSAPNPVIRAFRKLFDFIKRAGNIFRKNKINDVKDIFDKARLGDIGKRAKPQPDVDALRTKSLAQAEKAAAKGVVPTKFEYSLTDLEYGDRIVGTILPFLDARLGEKIFADIYNNPDITKPRIKARFRQMVRPEQGAAVDAIVDIGTKEKELIDEDKFLDVRIQGKNETVRIGSATSRRSAFPELMKDAEGRAELKFLETQIAKVYKRAPAEGAELALSTVKVRKNPPKEKIKNIRSAGKFFDDMVDEIDIMDNKAFNKAINETAKEVEFQKGRVLNGLGWYSKDATTTFKLLQKVFPDINKGANDQDMFTAFTAVLSPNRDPQQNVILAARVYDYYKKHGSIPIHNPATKQYWTLPNSAKQLSLLQYLLDKYGENGTVEFLRGKKTIRQMAQEQREAGANGYNDVSIGMKYRSVDRKTKKVTIKTTTKNQANYKPNSKPKLGTGKKLDDEFLGSMIFGPKVGRFFLDIRNIQDETEADGVTKDVWFARSFYRQFGQLTDNTPSSQDGLKGSILKKHEKRADEFALRLAKKTNLSPNDAQAALWYYEHELYADILKTPSKVRLFSLSDGARKFIKELNDGKYKEIESGQPSRGVEVRKRIKAQDDKTTKPEISTSGQKQRVKEELAFSVSASTAVKDFDPNAFKKSGSDVTAFKPQEYLSAVDTRGPLFGHCAACVYVIQKYFGGKVRELVVAPIEGYNTKKETHYFNELDDGTFIDVTGEQYGNKGVTPPKEFIDKSKESTKNWGKFDPKKSKEENKRYAGVQALNPRFIKFEEKYLSNVNKPKLIEPELSVTNKVGAYAGPIKVSQQIPTKLRKQIRKKLGLTPKQFDQKDTKLNYVFDLAESATDNLEKSYEFKSDTDRSEMLGMVVANGYIYESGVDKQGKRNFFFAIDDKDNILAAQQFKEATFPDNSKAFEKAHNIIVRQDSARRKVLKEYSKEQKLLMDARKNPDDYDPDLVEEVADKIDALREKGRVLWYGDYDRNIDPDPKYNKNALEIDVGASFNMKASEALMQEAINFAKSKNLDTIVLTDIKSDRSISAFARRGFKEAKSGSIYFGGTRFVGFPGEDTGVPRVNMVAEVSALEAKQAETTQNLDELTPELSISKDKKLINPPGSKITVDLAQDLETLENFGIQPTDDVRDKIDRILDTLYSRAKDFGDFKNVEATNMPLFLAGIRVDDKPVGFIQGAKAGDVGFIDYVQLRNEGKEYISPIGFRRVGKELSKLIGVKRFAGQRTTGSRKLADKDREAKGLEFIDESAVSADFSQQQFDEADSVQFSVSDKMLTDKEMQDSALPSNVKAKLFENRKLKDGTPVSIRPNLLGQVIRDDKKLFVQTIHPGKNLSKALGYDGAVRVTDPLLNVSQKARANIASKRQNKFPMAAAQGKLSKKKATLEGQVLNFNPFQHHLFVDPAGYAVKSIKGDAVMFNTKIYTTGTLNYYSKEDAPTPLENIESNVLYKYETEAEKKADQPLETDTLSKEKLREFNLEFAASNRKFSEGTQSVLDRINPKRSRKTVAAHWKDFVDNWGVKFQQGVSDQYISVKKFIGEEEYKALTMTYGSSGATEAALLYGVPFMDNDGAIDLKQKTLGTGLFTRFEKLGQDLPDFLAWVAANRARNLVNKGFESGLGNIKDINTAINELQKGKEKQFNESLKDLQEFNKAFLDIAVKSGYLDPASAKVWTEDDGYNFYIPFYRLLEDPDSNSGPRAASDIVNQPDYPRYRGADIPVNDLLQNIIRNYSFLTEASLKNAAGLKALEKGVEVGVARRVPNSTKTSVFVRNKGKIQHYEVDNKLVLESLTALHWNGWQNPAMNIMRNFKRYLTYGVTASPAFRIRNLIRDSIHSVAVGKLKYNPLENLFEGFGGLLKNNKKGESELRARMAFGGGSIHFGHVYGDDPNATQMLLDRAINVNTVMKTDGWVAGSRRLLGSKLGKSLKWWEGVGALSENVNRAALYKQLRDKGISHFEASYQARDLLNFSRHGANPAVRALTQTIPFLNARIQGLDKLGRAMTKEQRGQLIAVLGTYSLASIMLYLAYKDDEDFKEREQWDRDTYHWFKLPGDEGVFRIPRPFEVGAIGVIFERMVEQMVDDDVHGSLLAERIFHVIGETLAFDIRPQALTPALEVYSNKDSFTDRPIESMGMKRLPASERKYAYTSSAYVGASKLLELIPFEKVQLSPVQIEHLVQGYFGWVGSTVVSAISFVDYPRKYAEFFSQGFDSPLAMGFFKSLPSLQSKYKTQFYNQLTAMNEVFNLQQLYASRGEYNKALKLFEKNKNLLSWRKSYVKVNTKISQINRQIRIIQANESLTEAEKIDKVRQLNIIKNDMIQNLTEAVLSWEKSTGQRVKRPIWWK
jgi:hypothetical protein